MDSRSDELSKLEVEHFDYYYNKFTIQKMLGKRKNLLRQVVVSNDIFALLDRKLQKDYDKMIFFLTHRNKPLRE